MAFKSFYSDAQSSGTVRRMAVAGQFYPSGKDELAKDLGACFKEGSAFAMRQSGKIAAIIVPHAGYVFSGKVAAAAYSSIPAEESFEHIFLIGPSHHISFDGASVNCGFDFYQTPLGLVKVDTGLCKTIVRQGHCFTYRPDAHSQEHCIEVQLPFLQYHLKSLPPIVPIIMGTQEYSSIKRVAEALKPYFNDRNLFIISSDFSHYPSYCDAVKVDGNTGKAIISGDIAEFAKALKDNADGHFPNLATSACGQSAIAVLMLLTGGNPEYRYSDLLYENSGDSGYGGKDEVVGYHSIIATRTKKESQAFGLTEDEKKKLLAIARNSIESHFSGKDISESWKNMEMDETLEMKCGAFVTLNENGRLRGCIGHFGEDAPLFRVVAQMAREAAFDDGRFEKVEKWEMPLITIEISALSPLRKIDDIGQFRYGRQGIYMRKGGRGGTFLPQVAAETGWTEEEFLGHCARDKAEIGWDGWKTAELYTYEAIIFKEGE